MPSHLHFWRNMNHSDIINGLFEFFGSLFILTNIFRLYKDKIVRGVNILPTVYFTTWGAYNLYFYPHNGLPWSFIGGIAVFVTNAIWVGMALYYSRKTKEIH